MAQNNLRVTAHMATAVAVIDDWSPSLDSLLQWLILDEKGLASPNPTIEEVTKTQLIINELMPLGRAEINGEWYWQSSSPIYCYTREQEDRVRKRWQPGIDSPSPVWGKRKATFDSTQGAEKAYDLPLYLRNPTMISWYCVGDQQGIERLLTMCKSIGKKRSIGNGQILRWEVVLSDSDWHLWGSDGRLMRPIPIDGFDGRPIEFSIRNWGWRPPYWSHENRRKCVMPTNLVRKLD